MIGHRVVLRPRSFLEVGDLAFVFMRGHARLFAQLLPWMLVPALLSIGLKQFAGVPEEWALTVDVFVSSLLSGVYTLLCGDLMLTASVSPKDVQKRFLHQLPGYLVTRIASWAVLALSLGFGFRLTAFVPESALLERGGVSASISRSGALLRATPGRALGLGVVILGLLLAGEVSAELTRAAFRELFSLSGPNVTQVGETVSWAAFVGIALIQPYIAALRFLLYIDCRTRREGWDLQVQFGSLVAAGQSQLRHTSPTSEVA